MFPMLTVSNKFGQFASKNIVVDLKNLKPHGDFARYRQGSVVNSEKCLARPFLKGLRKIVVASEGTKLLVWAQF